MNKPFAQHDKQIAILRSCCALLISIAAWLSMTTFAIAASSVDEPSEYAVKAAFLFKFGAFVEWPAGTFESASAPLVIGIVGQDPFGATLDDIAAHHTISGRPVTIVRGLQIGQIENENILFISQSEKERMASILSNLKGKKVLTVSEFENPGVIIHFVVENDKVRFDIDLAQANRIGIQLSSKLLSVARNVIRE